MTSPLTLVLAKPRAHGKHLVLTLHFPQREQLSMQVHARPNPFAALCQGMWMGSDSLLPFPLGRCNEGEKFCPTRSRKMVKFCRNAVRLSDIRGQQELEELLVYFEKDFVEAIKNTHWKSNCCSIQCIRNQYALKKAGENMLIPASFPKRWESVRWRENLCCKS